MTKNSLPLNDVLGYEASDKRIDILRRIGQVGSISEAAREAGVSYKAAWQALETLTNLAGVPLVDKSVGGSGGGGALLTSAGQAVLLAADEMARARQHVLDRLAGSRLNTHVALALQTSMRNQFSCTIGTIQPHQGQVRIQLRLSDSLCVYSRITRESMQLLGLKKGGQALALCKATAVSVTPHQAGVPDSLNVVDGIVVRAPRSIKGGEVTLRLANDIQLIGFVEAGQSVRVGHRATAIVDESSIVIGMPQ